MRFNLLATGLFCLVGLVSSKLANSNEGNLQPSITVASGTPAVRNEFPALGVVRSSNGTLRCTGTLIGRVHVLTAAQCVHGLNATVVKSYKMIFDTLKVSGGLGSFARNVMRAIVHPSYTSRGKRNDVAVLLIDKPIPSINVTRFANSSSGTYANAAAVIAGWGTTASDGSISPVLLKANVTVLSNPVVTSQYGDSFGPLVSMGAAAPNKNTCQGDIGGPLYVKGIQVGIGSWGVGCNNPAYARIFARVSTYADWIYKTMSSNPT